MPQFYANPCERTLIKLVGSTGVMSKNLFVDLKWYVTIFTYAYRLMHDMIAREDSELDHKIPQDIRYLNCINTEMHIER